MRATTRSKLRAGTRLKRRVAAPNSAGLSKLLHYCNTVQSDHARSVICDTGSAARLAAVSPRKGARSAGVTPMRASLRGGTRSVLCPLRSALCPPPARDDESGRVQPTGCGDPTFIGAGFDLAELALTGARVVVSTLCEGIPGGYPEAEWDVGVLALRDTAGRLIAPVWSTHALRKHPRCQSCSLS